VPLSLGKNNKHFSKKILLLWTPSSYRSELFEGVKNSIDKKEELRRIVITTQRFIFVFLLLLPGFASTEAKKKNRSNCSMHQNGLWRQ